jgi:hypothetical protein
VSTTRSRVKYKIFLCDPRAQLLLDDSAGSRAVILPVTVEIREDAAPELQWFRAIREKYGMKALEDAEHLESLAAEGRVLLAITPDGPPSTWNSWGLGTGAASDQRWCAGTGARHRGVTDWRPGERRPRILRRNDQTGSAAEALIWP